MLPINTRDLESVPREFQDYNSIIIECLRLADRATEIAYLTVDERVVPTGEAHRRPGLHTESPGATLLRGTRQDLRPTSYFHPWGVGYRTDRGCVGGIFMASNVADSTAVYAAQLRRPGEDAAADPLAMGELGDCEHFRGLVGHSKRTLAKNELVWMSDLTIHESLPLAASTHRQFFRLVVGDIGAWYKAHSTANPRCMLPSSVKVITESKFNSDVCGAPSWAAAD
eukprot:m.143541 g.143541  ORF g.143541 m.143541 type:complete len:226 (-) comp14093_c0_seq4:2061-2738(-)